MQGHITIRQPNTPSIHNHSQLQPTWVSWLAPPPTDWGDQWTLLHLSSRLQPLWSNLRLLRSSSLVEPGWYWQDPVEEGRKFAMGNDRDLVIWKMHGSSKVLWQGNDMVWDVVGCVIKQNSSSSSLVDQEVSKDTTVAQQSRKAIHDLVISKWHRHSMAKPRSASNSRVIGCSSHWNYWKLSIRTSRMR